MEYKVELIKFPTEDDWMFCKICTLNTVGKKSVSLPSDEWKVKLLESEHSPIRELQFAFRIIVPYYISVHFARHSAFNRHYVQSQRNDRQDKYDRETAPQNAPVSHIISMNAQSFIDMAHARLCKQASKETRMVMQEMVRLAVESNPEFKSVLVPKCVYRNGKCTEFFPCTTQTNPFDNIYTGMTIEHIESGELFRVGQCLNGKIFKIHSLKNIIKCDYLSVSNYDEFKLADTN